MLYKFRDTVLEPYLLARNAYANVFGIGLSRSDYILSILGIGRSSLMAYLNSYSIEFINHVFKYNYILDDRLRWFIDQIIDFGYNVLRLRHFLRLAKGLTARGQRTHSNRETVRKLIPLFLKAYESERLKNKEELRRQKVMVRLKRLAHKKALNSKLEPGQKDYGMKDKGQGLTRVERLKKRSKRFIARLVESLQPRAEEQLLLAEKAQADRLAMKKMGKKNWFRKLRAERRRAFYLENRKKRLELELRTLNANRTKKIKIEQDEQAKQKKKLDKQRYKQERREREQKKKEQQAVNAN